MDETVAAYAAMEDALAAGKTRAIGVSNFNSSVGHVDYIAQMLRACRSRRRLTYTPGDATPLPCRSLKSYSKG